MTKQHKIEVVDYDPDWIDRFIRERDALRQTLEPWLPGAIEHVGSTAVPGLCAKPVIDIMIPVRSLAESRPAIAPLEQQHGYIYWHYKNDVMHWLCKPGEYVRTHHIHLVPVGSKLFKERIRFRNALRNDSALREDYATLKRRLAKEFPHDREGYTEAKGPFIRSVLDAFGSDDPQ